MHLPPLTSFFSSSASSLVGGAGGAGRISIYYGLNQFTGMYVAAGGSSNYENGGPGTVYLQKVPVNLTAEFSPNRTLYVSNNNKYPRNRVLDIRNAYEDLAKAPSVAWVTLTSSYEDTNFEIDELQVYGGARLAVVNPKRPRAAVNITFGNLKGDRSGQFFIGFNQSMLSKESPLLMGFAVYPGGVVSLQGNLTVSGVRMVLDGVLENCQNIVVEKNGVVDMKDMIDTLGTPTRVRIIFYLRSFSTE